MRYPSISKVWINYVIFFFFKLCNMYTEVQVYSQSINWYLGVFILEWSLKMSRISLFHGYQT